MSGKAAEIAGKWQTAAVIPTHASHHGVGNSHAVTYHLSVSGVHSTDDQVFDKAYDATVFRHGAAKILQEVGPRVGGKNDSVDSWVNIAATRIEVSFRAMMKEILHAGRTHNNKEREMLREWLSDRDDQIDVLVQERNNALKDMEELRAGMKKQEELLGRTSVEAMEQKQIKANLEKQIADMSKEAEEYSLRERQFVDSLAHCRRQLDEQEAEIGRLKAYMQNALQERTDTAKQYEQLRQDISEQNTLFTTAQQALLDRHAEETQRLNNEIERLQRQVSDLREAAMAKDVMMSVNNAAKQAAEAAAAMAHSSAKGEWTKAEAEFKSRIEGYRKLEEENALLQEYALTIMSAYQAHGYQVSRYTPHHAGVTKAWGDIYRYVASTVWGQAAGLKDLAQKFKYPIYQKQEHAFAAAVRPKSVVESKYLSDDDDAPGVSPMRNSKSSLRSSSGAHKTEARTGADHTHHPNTHRIRPLSATRPPGLQRSPSPGAAAGQPSLSAASRASSGSFMRADAKSPQTEASPPRRGGLASPTNRLRISEASPFSPIEKEEAFSRKTLALDESSIEYQVLSKMCCKWSTVHAQFSQFNGRPNARGGYDWNFNKQEWVNTLKVLNLGLTESATGLTFDALDDTGSGWVTFENVQEAMRSLPAKEEMHVKSGKGAYYSRTTTPSFNLPSFDTRSPSRQDVSQTLETSLHSTLSPGLTTMSSMSTPQAGAFASSPGNTTPSKRLSHAMHVLHVGAT